MKAIRIFLLALIIIGIGLIATQNLWVPRVVNNILQNDETSLQVQLANNASNTKAISLQTSSFKVSSPTDAAEYCFGDIIPINWKLPAGVTHYKIAIASPEVSAWIVDYPGITDQSGPVISYSYPWNQKITDIVSGKQNQMPPGTQYYIRIDATKNDSGVLSIRSSGTFSIINCHTQ